MDRPIRTITVDWSARVVGVLSLIISAGVALYLYTEFNSPSDDTNLRKIVDNVVTEKISEQNSTIVESVREELAKQAKTNEQGLVQRLTDFDEKTVALMNSIKDKWDQLADNLEEIDKSDRIARDAQFASYLDNLDRRVAAKLVVPDGSFASSTDPNVDPANKLAAKTDDDSTDKEVNSTEAVSKEVRLRPVRGFVNLLQIENKKDQPVVVDQVSFDPLEVVEIDRIPSAPKGVSRSKVKHLVFDELKHNRATVQDEHAEYRMPLKPFVIGPQDEVYLRGEIRSNDYQGYGFVGKLVFSYLGEVVLSADDATVVFVKR